MLLKINGKEYELRFGFDFIGYINKMSSLEMEAEEGINLKLSGITGMKLLTVGISQKMPSTLRLLIKGATITEKSIPSNIELENFIDELLEDENTYNEVYDEIVKEMGKRSIVLKEMGITREEWEQALKEEKEEASKKKTK